MYYLKKMILRKRFFLSAIFFVLLSFPLVGSVEASSILWSQTYGGDQYDCETSLVATFDGGYAIGGYTYSFGSGNGDFWLVKVDAVGDMQWNNTYGDEQHQEEAFALVTTSDGGYVLAGLTSLLVMSTVSEDDIPFCIPLPQPKLVPEPSDVWLVKTDASGNMEWNKTYGGQYIDRAFALIATSDGGYALAGETNARTGGIDSWLIKTDKNGNLQWDKTYGEYMERVEALVETSDGGYALAGYKYVTDQFYDFCLVKTDSLGNLEWTKTYDGPWYDVADDLVVASDGGFVLAGHKTFDNTDSDYCLIKTDAAGNLEWTRTYDNNVTDVAKSVVGTSDGGYILAGGTREFVSTQDPDPPKSDCWLIKTDSFGNMEWNQIYGGTDTDSAGSVVETSDGGYTFAGSTWSFGAGNADFWLVRTNSYDNIPEFPSWAILPLLLVGTLFVVFFKKRISL
jgi:hypothetical protein